MSGNGLYVGALVRSDKRLERPDLQLNISAWSTIERTRAGIISHPHPGIAISPVHLAPDGRGTVRLKSSDPLAPPEIKFNFLKSEYDWQALIAGMRFARAIVRQQAMQKLIVEETLPGIHVRTEADMREDIRARGVSNLHPVGSAGWGMGRWRWWIRGCACTGAGATSRRCIGDAVDYRGKHQCADHHDRREGLGHDPGGCPRRRRVAGGGVI